MDLRFTPEETRVPRRGPDASAGRRSRRRSAKKVSEGRSLAKDDYRHLPADPQRQGLGGAALAAGMGRPGLDPDPALHLPARSCSRRRCRCRSSSTVDMVGPVSRPSAARPRRRASCRGPPTSTTGGARASRSPAPARTWPRSKTRAVRDGDHYVVNGQKTWTTLASMPTGSSAWSAPTRGQEAAGHLVPAHRHEDPGHHRAADPDHRRPPRGQRGVLRRCAGAGREPGRRGEPGLGLRQVPARQRAHRHRPDRPHQGADRRIKRAGPGDAGGPAGRCGTISLSGPARGGRGRAEGAGDHPDAGRAEQRTARSAEARSRPPRSSRSAARSSSRRRPSCWWSSPGRSPWRRRRAGQGPTTCRGASTGSTPRAPSYFNNRKVSIYGGSNEIQHNIIAKGVLGL